MLSHCVLLLLAEGFADDTIVWDLFIRNVELCSPLENRHDHSNSL